MRLLTRRRPLPQPRIDSGTMDVEKFDGCLRSDQTTCEYFLLQPSSFRPLLHILCRAVYLPCAIATLAHGIINSVRPSISLKIQNVFNRFVHTLSILFPFEARARVGCAGVDGNRFWSSNLSCPHFLAVSGSARTVDFPEGGGRVL
jgi:hypothetical protein